jgi:Ca2+-transporting ATPase
MGHWVGGHDQLRATAVGHDGVRVPAVQVLWINMITDGLPALALGMDRPARDPMRRPPRPARGRILSVRRMLGSARVMAAGH